jgi:hypothetical protein
MRNVALRIVGLQTKEAAKATAVTPGKKGKIEALLEDKKRARQRTE